MDPGDGHQRRPGLMGANHVLGPGQRPVRVGSSLPRRDDHCPGGLYQRGDHERDTGHLVCFTCKRKPGGGSSSLWGQRFLQHTRRRRSAGAARQRVHPWPFLLRGQHGCRDVRRGADLEGRADGVRTRVVPASRSGQLRPFRRGQRRSGRRLSRPVGDCLFR